MERTSQLNVTPGLPSASEAWPVDDSRSLLSRLLLGVRPATPSLLPRSLRRGSDNARHKMRIVWLSGICPQEQDLPGALQVWHSGNGFSFVMRSSIFSERPDGCAQHRDSRRLPHIFPKLLDGLRWDPGFLPRSGFSFDSGQCFLQQLIQHLHS